MSRLIEQPAILIVDDELGMREGISRILSRRGFEVATASNGKEALELLLSQRFPILLVDLKMPVMDGFQLLQEIRDKQLKVTPIVVSAFATIESAVQTIKMGAFDFVVKPFTPDDLMVPVMRAVEHWQTRREAERLRRESEAHLLELSREKSRLNTIINTLGDGLIVCNVDGDIVLHNPAATSLVGQVGQSLVMRPLRAIISDAAILETLDRCLWAEQVDAQTSLEFSIPSSDSDTPARPLLATLSRVCDEQGNVLGAVIILKDLTEAKASDRMKNMFISMVAHEIKAPIGAVEGYLQLMYDGTISRDEDKIRATARRCMDRTQGLLALISDLLEVTRREAQATKRQVTSLNLGEIARETAEFHRVTAEQQQRHLTIEIPSTPPMILGDRHDIERLITNLVSNAIKYNRPGGHVRVAVHPHESTICLDVADTGLGMTPEERQRLGEEFYRVKNSLTRSIPGTGLGLALVRKIVAAHHAELSIESQTGEGSLFRVHFPKHTPA